MVVLFCAVTRLLPPTGPTFAYHNIFGGKLFVCTVIVAHEVVGTQYYMLTLWWIYPFLAQHKFSIPVLGII